MTSKEVLTRRLDLAARAIDLTLALTSTVHASNKMVKLAWEIGQWLGREGVNQYELQDCMEQAKGLVYPNQDGDQLFVEIARGRERKPLGPLFLEQSGSLGRLMARDPALCWMVSTTACLFQFHSNTEFVTAALVSLIIEGQGGGGPTDALFHGPAQTQIRAVVEKIVLSIWYNVVNAGCNTIPLPPELSSVCPRGHELDPADFAKVAHTLTSRCSGKVILKSKHLLQNVTLWLLLHYQGTIVVNLAGAIAYRKDFGDASMELEIHVEEICETSSACDGGNYERYSILQDVAGRFESFLSGISFGFSDIPSTPGTRRPLYEKPCTYQRDSMMWDSGIRNLIHGTSKALMRWLLNVPLGQQAGFEDLGFQALLTEQDNEDSMTTVGSILKASPSMLNLHWGIVQSVPPVSYVNRPFLPSRPGRMAKLSASLPIIGDLERKIRPNCNCIRCELYKRDKSHEADLLEMKPGCLIQLAFDEVKLFLAHGIADGFGAGDSSGAHNQDSIISGMNVLLSELCEDHKVRWDTWFSVAACVYLGCPFKETPGPDHPAFGGTAIAAIQFGDLAVQAPWLDLTSRLSVPASFHFIGARGRLGVVDQTTSQDGGRFRRVEENFAIIETESTEGNGAFPHRNHKDSIPPNTNIDITQDETGTVYDVILVSVHGCYYRILMRIKTHNHWRVIDPSDAMCATIRTISLPHCSHSLRNYQTDAKPVQVHSFEEVLGRWPNTIQEQSTNPSQEDSASRTGVFHVTQALDSPLKVNVARALSVCCTSFTVSFPRDCLQCFFEEASNITRQPLREGEAGNMNDRYLVFEASEGREITMA